MIDGIPRFSYFEKPISNTKPRATVGLLEIYHLIQGEKFADATNMLRIMQSLEQARKFKAFNFSYVTFSGVFSKRSEMHLEKHSGLLTIDFDHLRNRALLREYLLEDEYFETELLFTSPSGDGLKWIIPIDLSEVGHSGYFLAVANYIQQTYYVEVDQSGKDVSRACFLPHDPDVYINPKYLK